METVIRQLNDAGVWFTQYSWEMLLQSSLLIAVLFIVDFAIRKKVRAVFRYGLLLLVLVKLMLPCGISSPVSLGYLIPINELSASQKTPPAVQPNNIVNNIDVEIAAVPKVIEQPQNTVKADAETALTINTASRELLTWQAGLLLLWAVAVIVMITLLIQRIFFVRGLVRQSKNASERMRGLLAACSEQLNIKRKFELKVSPNATSPAVCGLFNPVILIPENINESIGQNDLRAILLHELAHIKRGDLWVNTVQTILQILYFYNPLLWIANELIRRVREQAVDEVVMVTMGRHAQQYPQTLLNVAMAAFGRPALSLRLIGVVESKKALKTRVERMLKMPIPKTAKIGLLGFAAIFIIAAILIPMAKAEKSAVQDEKTAITIGKESNFTAKLPNGVMVELVGVCEHPSQGKQWWRPDGSELAEKPWEKINGSISTMWGRKAYEFALKLNYPENNAPGYYIGFDEGSSSCSGELSAASDLRWEIVELPKNLETTNMHFAIASGKWKTRNTQKSPWHGVYVSEVVWQKPIAQGDKTVLSIAHSYTKNQSRLAAIDKQGNEYIGSGNSGSIDKNTTNMQMTFNVKLEDIKEFQLQTRPYEYYAFKDVSLRHNKKTDVIIEAEKPAVQDANEKLAEDLSAEEFSHALLGNWRSVYRHPNAANILQANFQPDGSIKLTITENNLEKIIAGSYQIQFEREPQSGMITFAQIIVQSDNGNFKFSRVNFGLHNGVIESKGLLLRIDTEPYGALEKVSPTDNMNILKNISEGKIGQEKFIKSLPNGVTVELVGVCEHPSKGKQWWKPDGEIIETLPYEVRGGIYEPKGGYQRVDLIARINANEENPAVKFIIPGATRSGSGRDVTINQKNIMDLWSVGFEIDSMLNSADVKAGVASGQWETISKIIPSFEEPQKNNTDFGQVEWLKAVEENGELTIYASNNFSDKAEFQVIAEDITGKTYPAYSSHWKGNAGLMSCEYKFHLSPDKVKEFKFQIRPYQWIEFKNVSLKPNFKTDVTISN